MAGDFSDDEWDIDDDQLQVLEHNAILSTQQQRQADQNDSKYNTANSRSGTLSRGSTEKLNSADLRRVAAEGARPSPASSPFVYINDDDSFDSPQLDEDGVPLVLEEQPQQYRPQAQRTNSETTQREQWRQSRYAQKHGLQPTYQARPPSIAVPRQAYQNYQQTHGTYQAPIRTAQQPSQLQPPPPPTPQPAIATADNEAIQAELEALRKEKELLAQNLNNITFELHTARGEISVVRSKNSNDLKAAERQLSILKKQMQEEQAKQQAALQSKDAAFGKLVTDTTFLKHDLDEATRTVKSLQRQMKERPLQDRPNDVNLSPRKGLANTLRDGFDDDEVMLSPSRSPAKRRMSKPNTPTKKRKQPTTVDAGMPALALSLSGDQDQEGITIEPDTSAPIDIVKDHESEQHLKFVQDVLAFHPGRGQDTIVEALINFAFPSEPSRPLSSILLSEVSKLKGKRLPADLLDVFGNLLQKCANEGYYKPTKTLLEVVDHILDIDPLIVDVQIIASLCIPIQALVKQNAAVCYLLADKNRVWNAENPKPKTHPDIDTLACLETLLTTAGLVVDEPELIYWFWRHVTMDVILMLLMPAQPLQVIHLTLDLVSTSILEHTFCLITDPEEFQAKTEVYVIDKLTFLLWDPPRHRVKSHLDKVKSTNPIRDRLKRLTLNIEPEIEEPPPTRTQICQLRLHALEVICKCAMTSVPYPREKHIESHHGTNIMLRHPNAIFRLVRNIYDEVANLYASHFDTSHLHAKLVNRGTTLLHHLLMSPQATANSSTFDLTRSLSSTGANVGAHRFRVVMTRIALGDSLEYGLEPGIADEVRDMAQEVMRQYSTPDEAKALNAAMGVEDESDEEEGPGDDETMVDDDAAEAEVMAEMEQ